MKILLVVDQFYQANNGTTISAQRFAKALCDRGNQLRVVSCGEGDKEEDYLVQEWKVPIFDGLIKSQGMTFAKPDKEVLRDAIQWADVVHFYMPFFLSKAGLKIAEELSVPHTAAFHVQPENITYTIGMGRMTGVNTTIYHFFRDTFFNRFRHIHCPSRFIAGELKKNGYTATLHVISNGIESGFVYRKIAKSTEYQGKYLILSIGRLSNEKRQDILIDAVAKSQYADQIQLILAGQGPKRHALEEQGKKLRHPPVFGFYSTEQLQNLIGMCDLYVHPADAEIEAISCIEAFASGLVPVISNSERSATPQFALDDRSLFSPGDSDNLAEKIDYWLSNPEERKKMERRYSEHGRQFAIDRCAEAMEEMFREEISDHEQQGKRKG